MKATQILKQFKERNSVALPTVQQGGKIWQQGEYVWAP
jgi:hypothetical protein